MTFNTPIKELQPIMNTYEVWCENSYGEEWCKHTYQAETAGKAKYAHWHYLQDGLWEEPFGDVVKHLHYRKIGSFKVKDLFGDVDQFKRVCEYRNIPFAYMGMRVEVSGEPGTIVGSNHSCNLDICFDGTSWGSNCHPHFEMVYYDRKGNIVGDYRAASLLALNIKE